MKDWKPILDAKHRKDRENAAIAALEARMAPFYWALFICIFLALLILCGMGWSKYAQLAEQNEQIVACLNGKSVWLDDAVLHCELRKVEIVAGIQP